MKRINIGFQIKYTILLFGIFLIVCPSNFYVTRITKETVFWIMLSFAVYICVTNFAEQYFNKKKKKEMIRTAFLLAIQDLPREAAECVYVLIANGNKPINLSDPIVRQSKNMFKKGILQCIITQEGAMYHINPRLYEDIQ